MLASEAVRPDEELTGKVWDLLRLGYNRQMIIDALTLMKESHWSTVLAEQMHGSLATMLKYHPEHFEGTLAARSTLHSMMGPLWAEGEQGVSESAD